MGFQLLRSGDTPHQKLSDWQTDIEADSSSCYIGKPGMSNDTHRNRDTVSIVFFRDFLFFKRIKSKVGTLSSKHL